MFNPRIEPISDANIFGPLADPLALFDQWLTAAEASEPNDPNAAALATCTPEGMPSVRMVLAKQIDDPQAGFQRFCIFTNVESRKGGEIVANPRAALCFHWKSLRRQIRVEGSLTPLSSKASDDYFHSRSRGSQISAAVSDQSRPLANKELLLDRAAAFTQAHSEEIPRPDYWRGFYLTPERIEFWISGDNRLHDRVLFVRDGEAWRRSRLYP
ncbi:MAG TPA: pyridoxamine 5'-phosphate oxidase [Acidobacteriaceae bacterium]